MCLSGLRMIKIELLLGFRDSRVVQRGLDNYDGLRLNIRVGLLQAFWRIRGLPC